MSNSPITSPVDAVTGTPLPARKVARIPVIAFGISLSTFFVISYVVCILFDLWFPDLAMRAVWEPLLPGFEWLTWTGFLTGLLDAIGYGWFTALIFGPLFNFFSEKLA